MPTADMIALLDRLNPKRVSLQWLLDDIALIVGDERVSFNRNRSIIDEIENLLKARGYTLTKTSSGDPREGIEGITVYERH